MEVNLGGEGRKVGEGKGGMGGGSGKGRRADEEGGWTRGKVIFVQPLLKYLKINHCFSSFLLK